jgi:hypothetical protein
MTLPVVPTCSGRSPTGCPGCVACSDSGRRRAVSLRIHHLRSDRPRGSQTGR